jgi:hypothetical protein
MRVGIWVYGLESVAAGLMDLIWGGFDADHQPIQAFGSYSWGSDTRIYHRRLDDRRGRGDPVAPERPGWWSSTGHHLFCVYCVLAAPTLLGAAHTWI